MITPVILCGGSGTRLWPLSRNAYPKQLLSLVSQHSLLQDTVIRTLSIKNVTPPIVICHEEYRFLVAEQLQAIGVCNATIILEPMGKNTAPAATLAALYLSQQAEITADPMLLVLPADHIIKDTDAFHAAVANGLELAEAGRLVTFGINPTHAETGYGYIKKASLLGNSVGYQVEKFVEKPDFANAERYVRSGSYLWNSGMFLFKASTFLGELNKYQPNILSACQIAVSDMRTDLDFVRISSRSFKDCPSDSIDYAVMEKTAQAAVVPLSAVWSDVGSWASLMEVQEANQDGNVLRGDVFAEKVKNSYLHAESRMLAVLGVSDHIVVETSDAVLVAHKDHSQSVKDLVSTLKSQQRPEVQLHRKVYRPWGSYETLDQSDCYQVKHITVKPGGILSLQLHHQRSEHWVVVRGTARVTRGDETYTLEANQSTYIPVAVKHRLENIGNEELSLIEVQSGSYLGEDDIVRFEDIYGRTAEENI